MERLRDSERSRLIRRQRARSGSGSVGTMWVMRNAEQPMGRRSASHVTSLLLYISCSTGAEKNAGRCEASPATTSLAACPLFAMDRSHFSKRSHSLSLSVTLTHTLSLSSILSLLHTARSLSFLSFCASLCHLHSTLLSNSCLAPFIKLLLLLSYVCRNKGTSS